VARQPLSSAEKIALSGFVALAIVSALLYYRAVSVGVTLFSAFSPDGRYKVEIDQIRDSMLMERSVRFSAWRARKTIVNRKLLFTGDLLDDKFLGLYGNPMWSSNSALELGYDDANVEERSSELKITNESSDIVAYVLIESSMRKLVLLEVHPGATVYQRFQVRGWLSCEGSYEGSTERFGTAVSVSGNMAEMTAEHDTKGLFSIKIRGTRAAIESTGVSLRAGHCCAPDRPDFDHE
jgi:hypothetical protein